MGGDESDPAEWETYPGERARYEEIDNAPDEGPTEDLDMSIFEGADGSTIPGPSPGAPREQTFQLDGVVDGAMSQDGSIRLTFTDTQAAVNADGIPITEITATVTNSSGHTQPVTLYLADEGRADGVAVWASHPLSTGATDAANAFPINAGDTITATLGAHTQTVDTVTETKLDLQLHLQRNDLEQALQFMRPLLAGYLAATTGFHDQPDVAHNIRQLQEGIHTAEQGLLHFDDPGLPAARVGRAQYYLEHLPLQRQNMELLASGGRMISPFSDDIREITTLRHSDSILSFYQNDVTIREHGATVVTDAERYGEFAKGEAIGRSFNDISKGILFGGYDAIVGHTEMSWAYPLMSLAVTGEATDHLGQKLSAGGTAAVVAQAAFAAGGKILDGLEATGRITKNDRILSTADIDVDLFADGFLQDKALGAIKDGSVSAVGAVLDDEQALAGDKPKNTPVDMGPSPSAPAPTSRFGGRLKKGAAALAVGVIGVGGVVIATSGDDPADESGAPDAAVQSPVDDAADEPVDPTPPPADPADPADEAPPQPVPGGGGVSEELQQEIDDRIADLADVPAPVGGPPFVDIFDADPPAGTTSDDEQRLGGGSLYVTTTYTVDWKAPIVVDNGIIDPGGTFQVPASFEGEMLIFADCEEGECRYWMELASGETLDLDVDGLTLSGAAADITEFCDRTIFVVLKVSDLQTINTRLVPDRLEGARLETGTCETEVYREITYSGGFRFVGSFADQ